MPACNEQNNSFASPSFRILIVDDNEVILIHCREILKRAGFHDVVLCSDSRQTSDLLTNNDIALVFLDLSMPHITGLELIDIITSEHPHISIAVITMANEVETAVECMRKGVLDYLVKPIESARLVLTVRRAMEERQLREEYAALKKTLFSDRLQHAGSFSEIITNNKNMNTIFRYVEAIATSHRPVQVTGETGTGKELMARAIHSISQVSGPFVAVNIAGLDDNLLSDTLFGHIKGAYTGADSSHTGLVEEAENGTLFLDEIGDLTPTSQIKLLRLIQEKEYLPLGANTPLHCNIRIITATHCNLENEMKEGHFRKDLFYRLQIHHINIPPLRERLDDLPLLANHFIAKTAKQIHREILSVSRNLLNALAGYCYPGNIRELDSMLFDAVSRHESEKAIVDEIKSYIAQREPCVCETDMHQSTGETVNNRSTLFATCQTLPTTREAGDMLVEEAMHRAHDNQALAAGMIGLSPSALNRRLKSGK